MPASELARSRPGFWSVPASLGRSCGGRLVLAAPCPLVKAVSSAGMQAVLRSTGPSWALRPVLGPASRPGGSSDRASHAQGWARVTFRARG